MSSYSQTITLLLFAVACGDTGTNNGATATGGGTVGVSDPTTSTSAASRGNEDGPELTTDTVGSSSTSTSSASTTGTGTGTGTGTDTDTDTGAGTGTGTGSGTAADECAQDPHEPNGDLLEATDLGTINDVDSSGAAVMGVLAGPSDEDWFRYHGTDSSFGTVDPARNVTASAEVTLCKYAACANGAAQTDVTCPTGTTPAALSNGAQGCCNMPGTLPRFTFDSINCQNTSDDDAEIIMRLYTASEACVDYTLAYHF